MVLVKIEKKRLVFGISGILLLFAGFIIGRVSIPKEFTQQPTPTIIPSPTILSTPAAEKTFKVTRVIDGDTIEIETGERVRYLGIDTPETVDPRKPVQCFGIEASKKNKELIEGKTVRLEKDITDRDKYGRLLRYVYVGDIFVNLELVKQGFAFSYTYPPDIKYQAEILAAERQAREANRGLWAACPAVSPAVPSPSASGEGTADCNIKGNISTSGEKIYHLPGCGSYAKTQIDEGRGERWFCSEEEAQAAGWRKALNCP
ncbi:thermonuclease family protein [Candidatus Gottesmanbacteria bacterium]|nr:thermonuclease family protein [Candidatus Gottesmanbacteria bacterium]